MLRTNLDLEFRVFEDSDSKLEELVSVASRPESRQEACRVHFSWYLFGPDNRLQHDIARTPGNGSWGYIVGTYDKDGGLDNSVSI